MSAENIRENQLAKEILAGLKSGAPQTGTVRSHATHDGTDIAWVGIQLSGLGERLVAVFNEPQLRAGEQVVIHCVPDRARTGHFFFCLLGTVPAPAVGRRIGARCTIKARRYRRVRAR